MNRYDLYQFDAQTFVVFDTIEDREVCVCSDYDDVDDAVERARTIVNLLNESINK